MNRAKYAPTAPLSYATVGSELTETFNEPPFRVFKSMTPKKFFFAELSLFQGGAYAPTAPLATPLQYEFKLRKT